MSRIDKKPARVLPSRDLETEELEGGGRVPLDLFSSDPKNRLQTRQQPQHRNRRVRQRREKRLAILVKGRLPLFRFDLL